MAEEFYAAATGIYAGNWRCSPRSSKFPGIGMLSTCFLDVQGDNSLRFPACGFDDLITDVQTRFSPCALSDFNRTLLRDDENAAQIYSYASILNESSSQEESAALLQNYLFGMSEGVFNNQVQDRLASSSEDHSSNLDQQRSTPPLPKSASGSKPYAINNLRESHKRPDYSTLDVKTSFKRSHNVEESSMMKRPRIENQTPLPTFKVRKDKLGDRITALQQMVSPFGKTDTASVLHEAIEYIKFLHDQVHALSTPYTKNGGARRVAPRKQELRSRGLCLLPISSAFPVAGETPAEFWTPNLRGTFK